MNAELVELSQVTINPKNPRSIKDHRFDKLVESIKAFPEMLKLRPIVVDENLMVLGGNMRLQACKKAKLKKVWVIKATELTREQQQEFIIKDNVGFGDWDWEVLANEWEADKLEEWGLEVPNWAAGVDENNMTDEDVDLCLQVLHNGGSTASCVYYMADKVSTAAKMKGGNQTELYQGNKAEKNLLKARMLEAVWPQYAKTVIRFNRHHHLVDWKVFK